MDPSKWTTKVTEAINAAQVSVGKERGVGFAG